MSEGDPGSPAPPAWRGHITLALCTLLHAFTHAYQTLLVPLYLMIVADLRLTGVKSVALVVTIYSVVYCLFSYPAGVVADHANRKVLLGVGLILNAIAILLMGWTHAYAPLLMLAVLAGLAGTIFHPAANALVTAHYPRAPGMAIGLLGIGAGIGFFAGPQFAGWRAQATGSWNRPCIEMGVIGVAFGIVFLLLAREARGATPAGAQSNVQPPQSNGDGYDPARVRTTRGPVRQPLGPSLRRRMLGVAGTLFLRDFTGVATTTLASVYLQRALRYDVKDTGLILGSMMLIAVVINPLMVYFSAGRRRLPTLLTILVVAGSILATVPLWPKAWVLPVLCAFQAFHLGSYAVSEAAMLERVPAAVRGRVVGIFLTVAGTTASTAPWIIGAWTDAMGGRASDPRAYLVHFGVLGAMIAAASVSIPFIASLGARPREEVVEPITEITPGTMEPAV